mgnify:CR=1 FL=1
MKTWIWVLVGLLVPAVGWSQAVAVSYGTTRDIPPYFVGVNGNVTGQNQPWDNPALRAGFRKTGATNLRYPAGTLANYWDWDRGWLAPDVPDSLMIPWVVTQGLNRSPDRYPLDNFAKAIRETGAEPIYVLNLLTRDLDHSLRGLRRAKALGLPVRLIELGNELYFNLKLESAVFPTPEAYGQTCEQWILAIKKEFPEARCAVLGTELARNERQRDWTARVLAQAPHADAVIFHVYTPFGLDGQRERVGNNAGQEGLTAGGPLRSTLEKQTAELALLADPAAYARMLATAREAASRYRRMNVPQQLPVWATEFNVRADSSALRGTWANALFIAQFYDEFLAGGQVALSCFHNIQGAQFGAFYNTRQAFNHLKTSRIINEPGVLSAGGQMTRWFADATRGRTKATALRFENAPLLRSAEGTTVPALLGWVFGEGRNRAGLLVNSSAQAVDLDLKILNLPGRYTQVNGPLTHYVQDTTGLTQTTGSLGASLRMAPHSVTLLTL